MYYILRYALIVTQFKLHITVMITSMKDANTISFHFIPISNVSGILTNKVTMWFLFRNFPTCGLPDMSLVAT